LIAEISLVCYWVIVWVIYGIVVFLFWFCMIMYVLCKCCGIVWNIKNESLRVKLIALTSGAAGIFLCSYGNEVINTMPSSIPVYLSFVIVFIGSRIDKEITENNLP